MLSPTADLTQTNGLQFTSAVAYAPEVPIPSDRTRTSYVSILIRLQVVILFTMSAELAARYIIGNSAL